METTTKVKLIEVETFSWNITNVYESTLSNLEIAIAVIQRGRASAATWAENLSNGLNMDELAKLALNHDHYTYKISNDKRAFPTKNVTIRIRTMDILGPLKSSTDDSEKPEDLIDTLFCSLEEQNAGCGSDFVKIVNHGKE